MPWYVAIKRSYKGTIPWPEFKQAFITRFSKEKNPKPVIKFSELAQYPEEKVTDFYNRVVKATEDLESLVPNGDFELPDPIYPRTLTNISDFAVLNAKIKRIAAYR